MYNVRIDLSVYLTIYLSNPIHIMFTNIEICEATYMNSMNV